MNWFDVSRQGLGKILERRGKFFAVAELVSNAWDTDATEVRVTLEPIAGRPAARLVVEDDHPEGFADLTHAWTLFAESERKSDATKRGRFNLGEKLVLALASEASIVTTTGGVRFDAEGRHTLRQRRERGSRFEAVLRMTREEVAQVEAAIATVIPPAACATYYNGRRIEAREHAGRAARVLLATEIADAEGFLRRSLRFTDVEFHDLRPGEVGTLYELGMPVCETGTFWHANVCQKVPLNLERDGVSPSFLRDVRTAMLNTMHARLAPAQAAAPWVRDALGDALVKGEAAAHVLDLRFGKERVIFDPSDPEANNIAVSRGMTVISGGALSADEWETVKRFGTALPAGQVTPSPKPYHPGGEPLKMRHEPTPACEAFERFAQRIARHLLYTGLTVDFADDREWGFNGTYRRSAATWGELRVNYARLRPAIESWDLPELLRFLVHELAHHEESNHLAENFHETCCRLGGRLAVLALAQPEMFRR